MYTVLYVYCTLTYVYRTLCILYSDLCILYSVYVYCILCILYSDHVYCTLTEVFLTLTEGFPCFFLSCKANARVKLAKKEHGPHSSTLVVICVVLLLFVLSYVLFVCKCVLYYCHRVSTQLQLTNISINVVIKWEGGKETSPH